MEPKGGVVEGSDNLDLQWVPEVGGSSSLEGLNPYPVGCYLQEDNVRIEMNCRVPTGAGELLGGTGTSHPHVGIGCIILQANTCTCEAQGKSQGRLYQHQDWSTSPHHPDQ